MEKLPNFDRLNTQQEQTLGQWEGSLNVEERELYNNVLVVAQNLAKITAKIPQAQVETISQFRGAFQFPVQNGKTSIQSYFEDRINQIRRGSNVQSGLFGLKADLDVLNEKVKVFLQNQEGHGSAKETEIKSKDTISRKDVDEKGTDFVESINRILKENNFKLGSNVIFFAERERQGNLQMDLDGSLFIRDVSGNRWGLLAVLADSNNYIRKA